MLKKILAVLAVILVVFAVVVALRPADFRVERSASIAAPPAVVFPHVNDLHQWQEWSPWAKKDPGAKIAFEGPAAGVGAAFSWAGNSEVGEGTMTNTESMPNERVGFRLDFRKPFAGTNMAVFAFKPEGSQTVVTWSMTGKLNFVAKAVSLFIDCDKMVGPDFEKGLADLKAISEAEAKK